MNKLWFPIAAWWIAGAMIPWVMLAMVDLENRPTAKVIAFKPRRK